MMATGQRECQDGESAIIAIISIVRPMVHRDLNPTLIHQWMTVITNIHMKLLRAGENGQTTILAKSDHYLSLLHIGVTTSVEERDRSNPWTRDNQTAGYLADTTYLTTFDEKLC